MGNILTLLESATSGTCYKSYKYCADKELTVPTITYDEPQLTILKDRYGETDTTLTKSKDLKQFANKISGNKPLFSYFLDGSRRTYKVDDIELNKRIFPIMAGQIGVACCERLSPGRFKCKEVENNLVISLPSEANPEIKNSLLFFNKLTDKINNVDRIKKTGVKFSKILSYSSKRIDPFEDVENKKYEHHGG